MNLLQRNFTISFTEEISRLNGTEFEKLCSYAMELILGENVLHKGHNLFAKPVAYTADFIATEFKTIGQCGTDPDYFIDYDKPVHDVERAKQLHPSCETVYLFSSQRDTGGVLTKLNEQITQRNPGVKCLIYDSERIAIETLNRINATTKIEAILEFLPKTKEYFKILPESNKLPAFKSKYYNREEEEEIISKMQGASCVQIYGISGIGKTELSISIGVKLRSQFETIIWLEGSSLDNGNHNLSSVSISKFNNTINLEFLIQTHKTLIIIDNFNDNVESFTEKFNAVNRDSKCLITSLQRNLPTKASHQLNFLNEDTAKRLLLESSVPPKEETAIKIIKSVGGYPLVLKLIKSAVEVDEFTWEEILLEAENIKDILDEKNKKLSNRIIGKLTQSLEKELSVLGVLNKTRVSRHFIKHAIGQLGINALENRSLIHIQDSYYFSIHQLIIDSIRQEVNLDLKKPLFYQLLQDYLTNNNEVKSMGYFAFMLNHRAMAENIYKSETETSIKHVILYALIQTSDYQSRPNWINLELNNVPLSPTTDYQDLLLLIEREELGLLLLRNNKEKHSKESGRVIEVMENLIAGTNNASTQRILFHHTGKFYLKSGKSDEAEKYFNKVLQIEPDADYVLLQLTRIYMKRGDFVSASSAISKVLGTDINLEEQSVAILLSFYEILSHPKFEDLRTKYIDGNYQFFFKAILHSLDASFDHPYKVLEKLSSHLGYILPNEFQQLCESLPFPSNVESSNELKLAYATINFSYYKTLKFSPMFDGKDQKMVDAFLTSEKYFLEASFEKDYDRKKLLDLYIMADQGLKAIALSEKFSSPDDPFVLQSKSKAYRLEKRVDEALETINKAINNGAGATTGQKAAFLNDKAETLKLMSDRNCLIVLEEAIGLQKTPKTITAWETKLNSWRAEFGS